MIIDNQLEATMFVIRSFLDLCYFFSDIFLPIRSLKSKIFGDLPNLLGSTLAIVFV